jgi:hypothetical protein
VACGRPDVTDEDRSAAGRPTLAGLARAIRDRNRQRAAERGRSPGLPDGVDFARVWCPRDPAALRQYLAGDDLAVWAEGDVLHVLWRGAASEVELFGGLALALWQVPGADDLWEASVRIRELDRWAFSLYVAADPTLDTGIGKPAEVSAHWRGPAAPDPLPEARPLRGRLLTHAFDSPTLGGTRTVTAYLPPVDDPVAGCVLADGSQRSTTLRCSSTR